MNEVLNYLDELFPKAHCELKYNKDYELLIAIVLSAQTTDKRVNQVTPILFEKYKSLQDLSNANLEDIEKIIKPIGTYKKKSIFIKEIANKLISDNCTHIPPNRDYLLTLSGVGRKTINVFLSEIYNEPSIAVDTHVERVSKRLNLVKENDTTLQIEMKLMKKINKERWIKTHHQLIFFGRYHCKAINPNCKDCKLKNICKYYKKKSIK